MEPDGLSVAAYYIDTRNFTEPIFVVVIMAIASSRPVVQIAETCMRRVASIGKQTPAAWWLSILIVAPLLGSFITEPAAMTIAALLLGQQFYRLEPTPGFQYATLGLLFVNISVGGTLTHFAAPPVLMVADAWHWNLPMMFTQFGWRAILGIVVATSVYYFIFRKHFAALAGRAGEGAVAEENDSRPEPAPLWVVLVHLGFVAWTVLTLHHPPFFIWGFLFFLAFTMATHHHQYEIRLKTPLMVGFFLAGLVTGGGLTVIANAPNPAGQSILSQYFKGGVSPLKLLLGAVFPTLVMAVMFMLLPR